VLQLTDFILARLAGNGHLTPKLCRMLSEGRYVRGAEKSACNAVAVKLGIEVIIDEINSRQGLASYTDAWFDSKPEPAGSARSSTSTGIYAVISRNSPFFALGEGVKTWHQTGGSSYLPAFSSVDNFSSAATKALADHLETALSAHGFARLGRDELAPLLPPHIAVETNLSEGPLRYFDALFHWTD
jgi:hypothetical protein